MNQKLIVIDGKVYKSLEEVPGEVRKKYEAALENMDGDRNGTPDILQNMNAFFEDRNKDGTPDAFEGMATKVVSATKIIADGKEYNSLDELPPEIRAKFEQAMGGFDANRNGVPDFLEGMENSTNQAASFEINSPRPASRQPTPAPAASIEVESTSGWMIALAGLLILLLCGVGAAGVWYFFLR